MANVTFYEMIFNSDNHRRTKIPSWFNLDEYKQEYIGWGSGGVTNLHECRLWLIHNCEGDIIIKDLRDSRSDGRILYFSSDEDLLKFKLSPFGAVAQEYRDKNFY